MNEETIPITYEGLQPEIQLLIDDVRIIIGDQPDKEGIVFNSNDEWAVTFQSVIRNWNATKPNTYHDPMNAPTGFVDVFELGMLYFGAMQIANQFMRRLPLKGSAAPYVDTSEYYDRWDKRAKEIKPEWIKQRNINKLNFLPRGAGSIDRFGTYGRSASIVPIMRSMPSWFFSRIFIPWPLIFEMMHQRDLAFISGIMMGVGLLIEKVNISWVGNGLQRLRRNILSIPYLGT